ncbi:MAG: hypothetical protein JST76_07290 [Bacteroidetes bacterium]|nr:hypothetical protein [Bacteroidota bacterium]
MDYYSRFKKPILLLAIALITSGLFYSCTGKVKKWEKARGMSDKLLADIATNSANSEFPERLFPKAMVYKLTDFLGNTCDFKNRKGLFINDFYSKQIGPGNTDKVAFIYEYYLKCDSLRIITAYDLGNTDDSIELVAFRVEKIREPNRMILKPERCLKY